MRIGEVAMATGFKVRTLRYYETVGLVRPSGRTSSGYRVYEPDAVERLRFVRGARGLGLSLSDVRAVLEASDSGDVPCEHVIAVVDRNLDRLGAQLRRLRKLRSELVRLKANLLDAMASGSGKRGRLCPCISEIAT